MLALFHCWPHQHRPFASIRQVPVPQQRSSSCMVGFRHWVVCCWIRLCGAKTQPASPRVDITVPDRLGSPLPGMQTKYRWLAGCFSSQNHKRADQHAQCQRDRPQSCDTVLGCEQQRKNFHFQLLCVGGSSPPCDQLMNVNLSAAHAQPLGGLCGWLCPHLGRITESMTWITPLSATMSVLTTLAASTLTPPAVVTVISLPCTVLTLPALTSAAITLPGTTW